MPSNKKKSRNKPRKSKNALKKKTARSMRVNTKSAKKRSTRKTAQKKAASKASSSHKKRASVSAERQIEQEIRGKNLTRGETASGQQSADFQGLSRTEQADSESVDELVEEGNLFEAGVVAGVEEADNADEREVHTHEVPEDDVPEEYIDKE
jgi:hypothetical protein